jgi:hypothetical protein
LNIFSLLKEIEIPQNNTSEKTNVNYSEQSFFD